MGRKQGRDVEPSPKGVAGEAEIPDRKALLRQFGYKLS
jgi:adenosine/AMP kinase